MSNVVELNPHKNMTVKDCLSYAARNADDYTDVIVVGYDEAGEIMLRSSHLSRAEATFMLLAALDHARGLS